MKISRNTIYRQLCGQSKDSLILLRDVFIIVIIERDCERT